MAAVPVPFGKIETRTGEGRLLPADQDIGLRAFVGKLAKSSELSSPTGRHQFAELIVVIGEIAERCRSRKLLSHEQQDRFRNEQQ